MPRFADEPDVPDTQRASASAFPRYEDVTQDGRLTISGIPHFTGPTVWGHLLAHHPLIAATQVGVLPIITRMLIEGGGGPISVGKPITSEGGYQLSHSVDEHGQVARLHLVTWTSLTAPRARTHGPHPDGAGEPLYVGRVISENVFTRPFAPAGQRKVTRFDVPGVAAVPPARHHYRPAEDLLALPEGATWLEDALAPDEAPVVFGLAHTDSNQHVNSLVYPRLFEEVALRRVARLGLAANLLARRVETAYRKPCFAGDRMRFWLRAFSAGGQPGAVGILVPDDAGAAARPHAFVRVELAP